MSTFNDLDDPSKMDYDNDDEEEDLFEDVTETQNTINQPADDEDDSEDDGTDSDNDNDDDDDDNDNEDDDDEDEDDDNDRPRSAAKHPVTAQKTKPSYNYDTASLKREVPSDFENSDSGIFKSPKFTAVSESTETDNNVIKQESPQVTPPPVHLSFRMKNPITVDEQLKSCKSYDIVPYTAALHACPVYCVGVSWGMRWMFTGGQDGFIRRYNFFESVNNKLALTVAQRHPFVDSITQVCQEDVMFR